MRGAAFGANAFDRQTVGGLVCDCENTILVVPYAIGVAVNRHVDFFPWSSLQVWNNLAVRSLFTLSFHLLVLLN